MRLQVSNGIAACLLATTTWAQGAFEPTDFNATDALIDLGVNVSAIPALDGLVSRSSLSGCSTACASLQLLFSSATTTQKQTAAYAAFEGTYWSQQQASVTPQCVFKPSSAAQVSIAVLLSRLTQCPFAVKSGGHAAFTGASNIPGGITVSLEKMKSITLSSGKSIASVEPGNTWYDVYTDLQAQNIAVIGGRVAAIGVGGLTLGGGISFFSNEYGWACDNVASYEVVTASGIMITASPTTYPDLYWALRGGGNNFGIVTKFNLYTITQGEMWGGSRIHLESDFPALIEAFYDVGVNAEEDPAAAQILNFAYAQSTRLAAADLQYAKPIANASIFSEYLALTPIQDTTKVRTLADLTVEFNSSNPSGLRETYWAATFKLDKNFTSYVKDVFYDELTPIEDVASLVPATTLQVITIPELEKMSQRGGNPLGLSPSSGPLLLANINMMWADASDDARVLEANANIIARTVAAAKAAGLYEDYIYMNYASQYQAVIPSYGAANQARLKSVAKTYDPTAVFQTLQPGYFKLDGAPDSSIP